MTIYAFVTESEPVPTEIYNVTFTDSDLGDNISEQKKVTLQDENFQFVLRKNVLHLGYQLVSLLSHQDTFFLRAALSDLPQKNTFNVKYKDTYPAPLVQQKHHN